VIDESDSQFETHFDLRISTFLGRMIDGSDEYENASDSMTVNRELDLNVIDESEEQNKKHYEQRISTLLGIKTD
jgi:hypothetical protein